MVLVMPSNPTDVAAKLGTGTETGSSATVSLTVTDEDTAIALGSGDVPVVGTPRLIALCEEACISAVAGRLGPGRTTVASQVHFDHLAPVGVGGVVTAEATLKRIEGRRLVFTVSVRSDTDAGLLAAGRVVRVLVDREKFLAKMRGPGAH
jgi:fluoroacetyl-CoA thioesterase